MDSRDAIIDQLRALLAKQAAQLEEQAAQLEQQATRIKELELALAKAKQDSSTSSKPPSSDITKPQPKRKKARDEGNHATALSPDTSDNYARHCCLIALTKPSKMRLMTTK